MSNRKRAGSGPIPRRQMRAAEAAEFDRPVRQAQEAGLPEIGSPEGTGPRYRTSSPGRGVLASPGSCLY